MQLCCRTGSVSASPRVLTQLPGRSLPRLESLRLLACGSVAQSLARGNAIRQGRRGAQELVFMGERCLDERRLRDYGISEDFIVQARPCLGRPAQSAPAQTQHGLHRPAQPPLLREQP